MLTFRVSRAELLRLDRRHLAFGLLCTWVVGAGRYWDDPGANVLQHLGLGSVIYVFVLAAVLWGSLKPIGAQDWTYSRVLTFVTLTAPPAMLYAIPVERFMSLSAARTANVWFLAVVAAWRVALYIFFARRVSRLHWFSVTVGSLLPLSLIVAALTFLNLERAVFNIMGGLRDGNANDSAYQVLVMLTFFASMAFPFLLLFWLVLAVLAFKRRADPG